ncbi:MAG: chemotaxis response regulator protein-glutamate methylesterase [Dehalococcoidia bacterium]|nr:chemotaxis response regulator protein-glutamate methylesterase [Dehalococcoidia bacterium]
MSALPSPQAEIRVLVVDDSAFMRRTLERMINALPGAMVVGTANDGVEAVQRALELRPDVITMDVEMPRMDGVRAVGEIMQVVPTPVVMLSTLTSEGAETTIRALEAGAVDAVAKPSGLSHELVSVRDQLTGAILRAKQTRVQRRRPRPVPVPLPPSSRGPATGAPATSLLVIGSSTGGPPALTEVVPRLPGDLSAGVIVVQHMPPGFTAALARRLDSLSPLQVREAAEGDAVTAGVVLVAPGDHHLTVTRDRRVHLDQRPALHGVRPAVDLTLDSVAELYGRRAVVAILTGMGRDGGAGCAKVEQAGGQVIVQDEATSVVYGMPRVAREMTKNSREAPIERIADTALSALSIRR